MEDSAVYTAFFCWAANLFYPHFTWLQSRILMLNFYLNTLN